MLIINERTELVVGRLHSLTVCLAELLLRDEGRWHLPYAPDPPTEAH